MASTILLSSCVETMTQMLNQMLRAHSTILKIKDAGKWTKVVVYYDMGASGKCY